MGEPKDKPEEPLTQTAVLRVHFGESYKFWIWIRKQFTPASISLILGILAAAAGYISHLRENVAAVTTRVVVLETRVIPVLDQSNKTAALETELKDHNQRISRLEDDYDTARNEAVKPLASFRRRRP